MKNQYISLSEAARYCSYSQEYLSLRARQRKLKSKKIGRNWVTTLEWLKEYIQEAEKYNGYKNGSKGALTRSRQLAIETARKEITPPENLPMGEPQIIFEKYFRHGLLEGIVLQKIAFASAFVALIVMIGAVGFLTVTVGTDYTASIFGDYKEWLAGEIYSTGVGTLTFVSNIANGRAQLDVSLRGIGGLFGKITRTVKDDLQFAWNSLAKRLGFFAASPEEKPIVVSDGDLSQKTVKLEETIIGDIQQRFGEFREEVGLTRDHGDSEGLVVVPSTDKDEEIKEKLRRSFSDEVIVERVDETSGIIRPIFRKVAEQAYLYMMVPLKN